MTQMAALDVGATLAYWRRDKDKALDDLREIQPTIFPSVPRIFEKIYEQAQGKADGGRQGQGAGEGGRRGQEGPRARARGRGARARAQEGVRAGRQAGPQRGPRPVRGQPAFRRDGGRARGPRDAGVLRRLRGADPGGLRRDRDLGRGGGQHARRLPLRHGRQGRAGHGDQDRRGPRRRGPRRDPDQGPARLRRLPRAARRRPTSPSTASGSRPATSARWTTTAS